MPGWGSRAEAWNTRFWAPLHISLLKAVLLRVSSVVGAAAIIGLGHDWNRRVLFPVAGLLGFSVFWVWRKTRQYYKEWWAYLVYVLAMLAGYVLLTSRDATQELGVAPPIAVFGGLGAVLAGAAGLLSAARGSSRVRTAKAIRFEIGAIAIAVVACVVGFVILQHSRGDSGLWWVLVLGAVVMLYVSLSLLSESLLEHEAEEVPPKKPGDPTTVRLRRKVPEHLLVSGWGWPVAAAAAAIVTGILLVFRSNISVLIVAAVALGLLALFCGVAADGVADMAAVLVVVSLTWSLAPRTEALRAEPLAAGQTVLVALGDSYMSGEGATTFFDGTNDKRRNECRRAPSAYAPLLVAEGNSDHEGLADPMFDNLVFLACSGAKAADLDAHVQYPNEPPGGPTRLRDNGVWEGGATQLEQLDEVLRNVRVPSNATSDDPARDLHGLVLVSLGGNDAGFGKIATTCVGLGNCADVVDGWTKDLDLVKTRLDRAYAALRSVIGPRVPVLVVPYPIPLAEKRCDVSVMNQAEHDALRRFVQQLNAKVEQAATTQGFSVLDVQSAFADHRICDTNDPNDWFLNYIAANPTGGSLTSLSNPRNWFHNSLHPNAKGHEAIAKAVKEWVTQHSQAIETSRFELSDEPFRLAYLPEEGPRPSEEMASIGKGACTVSGTAWEGDWTACEMGKSLKWYVLPGALFLVALWVLAFTLLHGYRMLINASGLRRSGQVVPASTPPAGERHLV